jgi:Fe-S oxidoreductase
MSATSFSALAPILAACAVALLSLAARALRWRRGRRPARTTLIGLFAIPRRYLVNVHEVVARRPAHARMHMLAAGGLLAAALFAVLAICGVLRGPIGAAAVLAAGLAGIVGALIDFGRRRPQTPAQLSGGPYRRLPGQLMLANVYLVLAGMTAATGRFPAWSSADGLILFAFGLAALLPLAMVAGGNALRHAFAGALHLAFHPRPGRFEGGPDTALRPLPDVGAAPKLGADRIADFGWNQLLGFDACVQCGRCEEACPAFAAGLPLNPKKLVNDIAGAMAPTAYDGSPHPGLALTAPGGPILLGAEGGIAPETLWACTTCRACVNACPMMIEHVDAVIDLRRFATLELGETPGKAPDHLAALHEADTLSGRALAARLDFASDLNLPRASPDRPVEVLLWIGEGGYDLRNQRSLRALIQLLRAADVDFAVLEEERDCGDAARRLGDEVTFQRLAEANIAALGGLAFERIVSADPHAVHCLSREYAAFGGHYEVLHHATFLDRLVAEGRLHLKPELGGRITYHDPCYLGRYLGETAAPRALLDRLGAERVEMERRGTNSFCCGGGGGAPLTDIQGKQRIPDLRMAQARSTGAETLVVACPTCTIMLEGVAAPRPAVRELAEMLLESLDRGAAA